MKYLKSEFVVKKGIDKLVAATMFILMIIALSTQFV